MKAIIINKMDKKEYMETYGEMYDNGDLWDFPQEELSYLMENNEHKQYALIEDRLYELYEEE